MFKTLTTLSVIFCSTIAFAQRSETSKISGTIRSMNSGEPIPFGTVMFSKISGTQCDSIGRFTLYNLKKGKYRLVFSAFGYTTRDTLVDLLNEDVDNFEWLIYTDCLKFSVEEALKDIRNKRPLILLQGGEAPIVYTQDRQFEKKYGVRFQDFGCIAPDNRECLMAYNKTVFEYLDRTFGKKWRGTIRKDAIGFRR